MSEQCSGGEGEIEYTGCGTENNSFESSYRLDCESCGIHLVGAVRRELKWSFDAVHVDQAAFEQVDRLCPKKPRGGLRIIK